VRDVVIMNREREREREQKKPRDMLRIMSKEKGKKGRLVRHSIGSFASSNNVRSLN
jgi:hypothetical protein